MKRFVLVAMTLFSLTATHAYAQNQSELSEATYYSQMAIDHGLDSVDIPGFVCHHLCAHRRDSTVDFPHQREHGGAPLNVINGDFETGDYTSWNCSIGENTVSSNGPLQNIQSGVYTGAIDPATSDMSARHNIMTAASGNDPEGGFPIVPPGYGAYVSRLGNTYGAWQGQAIEQTWIASPADSLFRLSYAVVIFDGSHPVGESPYFEFQILDSIGDTIYSRHDESQVVMANYLPGVTSQVQYLPWETDTFDLTPYIGTTVTLRIACAGCIWSGHWAYCYVDLDPTFSIGIEETNANKPVVFPNPSSTGLFSVWCNNADKSTEPMVVDVNGRNVNAIISENERGWQIDISSLSAGIYSVLLPTQAGTVQSRLIKL